MKKGSYCNDCKKCYGWCFFFFLKCTNCNLTRGDKKCNSHCGFCFINLFPNDPKSIKARSSKEAQVVINIWNKYPNFICNKQVYVDLEGGCCETKNNLRMLINTTMLCIEYIWKTS